MRGCGLRIEEALAVSKEDFIEGGTVLRVMWQASKNGRQRERLKHRKRGEYRDVPVPSWLWGHGQGSAGRAVDAWPGRQDVSAVRDDLLSGSRELRR
jgi:hypothetical protein